MIYRFVVDGGPWMLPILGASVIGLALALERLWYWLVQALVHDRGLRKRLRSGEAPPPGQTIRDPVARVLVEAVRRPDDLGIASARAEAILRESKAYLGLLRFVGGTAALGGLLGTIFGVRDVLHHTVDPAQVNAGIANALHPTILGLGVFLVVHTAAAAFHALTASLARELDEHLDDLARILRRGPILGARPHSSDVGLLTPPPSLAALSNGAAASNGLAVAHGASNGAHHSGLASHEVRATPAPVTTAAVPATANGPIATVTAPAPVAPGAMTAPAATPAPVELRAPGPRPSERLRSAPTESSVSGPDAHELAQALAAAGGD